MKFRFIIIFVASVLSILFMLKYEKDLRIAEYLDTKNKRINTMFEMASSKYNDKDKIKNLINTQKYMLEILKKYDSLSNIAFNKNLIDAQSSMEDKKYYLNSPFDEYYFDKRVIKLIKQNATPIKRIKPSKLIDDQIIKIVNGKIPKTIYVEKFYSTITVIPIVNQTTNEIDAFVKIREKSYFIPAIKLRFYIVFALAFLFIGFVILFIYKQNIAKQNIEKERKLTQSILNATPNITFVTDFKTVEYANSVFLNFFNILSKEKFNKLHPNVLDIFLPWDNYLHKAEGASIKEFIQLIINTNEIKRKVMVFDKSFNLAAFSVSISKVNYNSHDSYLLTLTNITQHEIDKKQIKHKAYYDGLTKVFNRNKFNELFEIELRKSRRYKIIFCVAIIDVDLFKNFNDTYGHLIGDEVLISLANEVNTHLRDTDTFARWGGEEFTIIFSDTSVDMAYNVANKLRERILKLEHKVAGRISASFGVTQYRENDTIETMFKRCDDALYVAKENGRNRVEIV